MRVLLVVLLLAIAGCSTKEEAVEPPEEVEAPETDDCMRTRDCEVKNASIPTGPVENVTIQESGDASDGYDGTFQWSVHPNATKATAYVEISDNQGSGNKIGAYGYEVRGPGVEDSRPCPQDLDFTGSFGSPIIVMDEQDMAVGDWTLHLCLGEGNLVYDIDVQVTY